MPVGQVEVKPHGATWRVNLTSITHRLTYMISEEFSVDLPTPATWWISMQLEPRRPTNIGQLRLCICRGASVPGPELGVRYFVSIVTSTKKWAHIHHTQGTFVSSLTGNGWNKLISRLKFKRVGVIDAVTIHIKIWPIDNILAPVCLDEPEEEVNAPADSLTDDPFSSTFKMWHLDQTLADVIVTVNNVDFPVHKLVLASRSPVFKQMFEHNMLESITSRVIILDCEPEVFVKLLEFMYTGGVEDLKNCASELLKVADKYEMERLKGMCETNIISTLSVENAMEIYAFADFFGATKLREKTLDFIANPVHTWAIMNMHKLKVLYLKLR